MASAVGNGFIFSALWLTNGPDLKSIFSCVHMTLSIPYVQMHVKRLCILRWYHCPLAWAHCCCVNGLVHCVSWIISKYLSFFLYWKNAGLPPKCLTRELMSIDCRICLFWWLGAKFGQIWLSFFSVYTWEILFLLLINSSCNVTLLFWLL